jgi:hypothetical protein
MCSYCLFSVVVMTSLEHTRCHHLVTRLMTVADLLQVVQTIKTIRISSLYVCMTIKHIIVSFVETPRKFITAKLSIRKPGSSSVLIKLCSNKFTWCFHKQNYYKTIRLIQAVRNKMLREFVVINLLTTSYTLGADATRLVEITCCESVGLINYFITR